MIKEKFAALMTALSGIGSVVGALESRNFLRLVLSDFKGCHSFADVVDRLLVLNDQDFIVLAVSVGVLVAVGGTLLAALASLFRPPPDV